jgi:predicted RNA-binding Zn-ribbon protein involved in translation (DUF1610 family)
MVKRSAFLCPECGKQSLRVVRTVLVGEGRRIRFYVCQTENCKGMIDTEENVVRHVCADVQAKS